MKKTYQAPAVEVMGLDGDRHVMMASNSLPGVNESPSDTEYGSQANVSLWDDIWCSSRCPSFHIMLVRFRMRSALGSDSRRIFLHKWKK